MRISALMVSYNAVSKGQISETGLHAIALRAAALECEMIITDNGSPDGSAGVLEEWSRDFPHVRIVRCASRLPYVDALSRSAAFAQGELLLIVDADEANQIASLPMLIAQLGTGDCFHGLRASRKRSIRCLSSALFNFVYRHVLGHCLRDIGHNHYLMRQALFMRVTECVATDRLIAFPFAIEQLSVPVVQAPVRAEPEGHTSYGLWRRWSYVIRLFRDAVLVAARRRAYRKRELKNESVRPMTSS